MFPLAVGGKAPLFPSAHPEGDPLHRVCKGECGRLGHGFNDATLDPDKITAWWAANPNANIGIRTGIAFDAVDFDGPEGETAFDEWWSDNVSNWAPNFSLGLIVGTPRLGQHWYGPVTGAGNRAGMLNHVDHRGIDGYVAAPPSVRPDGRYVWLNDPAESRLIEWPDQLVKLINKSGGSKAKPPKAPPVTLDPDRGDGTRYGRGALRRACSKIASEPEGHRNHVLNAEAYSIYRLVGGGELTEAVATSWLRSAALTSGLTESETALTLDSARDGMSYPRSPKGRAA